MEHISSLLRARQSHVELAHKVDYRRQHLSLKQRMMIISRRDRMGRTKPGALRVGAAALALLLILCIGNFFKTRALSAKVFTPVPVGEGEVQMTFVGDIMTGRYVQVYGERSGFSRIFGNLPQLWQNSSLVFANLECAVVNGDPDDYPRADKLTISSSREGVKAAVDAGINVFSLANNHAVDYGRVALRETVEYLSSLGVDYAGAGRDWEEAPSYKILDANGVKVGFVAGTNFVPAGFAATNDDYGVSSSFNSRFFENVQKSVRESDVTVVYIHFGKENVANQTDDEVRLAHKLIESGADIVIGSHPHVLQPVEIYENQKNHNKGIIFYSLGNFIFDQGQRPARNTVLLQLNFNKDTGNCLFTAIPMHIDSFHPTETENPLYLAEIQRTLTSNLPKDAYRINDDGRIEIYFQVERQQIGW